MPVDLSRVNISLQQFQDISSGKYNAGEVKLESETTLGKINHHVHRPSPSTRREGRRPSPTSAPATRGRSSSSK